MKRIKKNFRVRGMTCPSCEGRIEKALTTLPGVEGAKASFSRNIVEVEYRDGVTSEKEIRETIEKAGYEAPEQAEKSSFFGISVGIVIVVVYLLVDALGGFALLPDIDASFSYGMLLLAGFLTSFHCVAMCGGIVLSQSLPGAGPDLNCRIRPPLVYNAGRLLSYTGFGAMAGALGEAFGFSPAAKGIITAAAGIFMLIWGLRMLGLLRRLPLPSLPFTRFFKGAHENLSRRGPFMVGLLNGFLPCGPLQTMQIYALGTGSAFGGALSMFLVGIGTIPLLLGFGLAAAVVSKKHTFHLVRAGAVLVLFLGILTIGRALTLSGVALPEVTALFPGNGSLSNGVLPKGVSTGGARLSREESARGNRGGAGLSLRESASGSQGGAGQLTRGGPQEQGLLQAVSSGEGVQRVVTKIGPSRYLPFVVKVGIPVEWTIRVKAGDLNGCNNPLVVPAYGLRIRLKPGDNLVTFTPKKEGTIAYSCWMGMIRSRIHVVSDYAGEAQAAIPDLRNLEPEEAGAGGSCCSGASSPDFARGRIPVDTIGMPVVKNGIQEMTIKVNENGYYPAAVVLQRGMKAKFVFNPESLNTCNSLVVFPEYRGSLDLRKGEFETPPLEISVDFTFQCWMGMLNGYVKVVDDISRINVEALRKELGDYRAPGGEGSCCSPGASLETP